VPHIILHMSYGRNPVFRKNSIPGNDIQTWKDIHILVNLLQFKGHVQDLILQVLDLLRNSLQCDLTHNVSGAT